MSKKETLSVQSYRGTKDVYPDEQRIKDHIFDVWHETARRFGYEKYDGPLLEPLELYAAKSSEEIVAEQLYTLTDKGDRRLGLRPEMTPTLARMVAAKGRELPTPIRWYCIATCMRFERPQRGRLRQFDQLNVDIFGSNALDEDAEILSTIPHMLAQFGATTDMYQVRINHRGLVNSLLARKIGYQGDVTQLLRILDGYHKVPREDFCAASSRLGMSNEQIAKLQAFMDKGLGAEKEGDLLDDPSYQYVSALFDQLKVIWDKDAKVFQFDPTVMRGFDYYTGVVFEVVDISPDNRRALFGGGRYENLVEAFGADPMPGVGYGVSDTSIFNFLEVHGLLPELHKHVDFYVIALGDGVEKKSALKLARELRENALAVETSMGNKKLAKALSQAQRSRALGAIIIGSDEVTKGVFVVKWLGDGKQETFAFTGVKSLMDALHHRRLPRM